MRVEAGATAASVGLNDHDDGSRLMQRRMPRVTPERAE